MLKIVKFAFIIGLTLRFLNPADAQTIQYEREMGYGSPTDVSLPLWVRKMYSDDPNVYEVENMYIEFYKKNQFVKNQHTQYFKRWKNRVAPFVDKDGFIRPPLKQDFDRQQTEYLNRKAQTALQRSAGNWDCIGPFDFDKDAAGRSHAPGAAHVYTLEKAPSNPDILYCGTATAGVWKTVDRGLNWTNITKNLPFTYCNALEIHPTNPNMVWIGANNRIYKTVDGGTNWTSIGDATFTAPSHDIYDLALKPNDPTILFVASDKGFYRSTDSGNNYTKVIDIQSSSAYFSEIEFKPDDPNTIFVVQSGVANKYTEFYKSTDGGLTFTNMSSWPVIASASTVSQQYINRLGANNSYASFANDNLATTSNPDFTIEMRLRVPNAITDKAIFSNKNWDDGDNNGWMIGGRSTGQLMFNIGNGSTRLELFSSGIWDNSWHHIAIVYRANGSKELYKDGVLVDTSTTAMTITNTNLPMILGRDGNLNYGGFDIDVDDIRIWNAPLSATEISTWQNTDLNNTHANYANLLHYYKCNTLNSATLTDENATNHGTVTGTMTSLGVQTHASTTLLTGSDQQKRAEISVTAANPNRIYALLSGEANGGKGLYGVYVSDDAGATWTHKCCGPDAGGAATEAVGGVTTPNSNANLLGYSETGNSNDGQYYYDLAMDADPTNADKVHIGGINHWYSTDGGTTFTLTAKWSWPADAKYIHADIHGIHIYGNEVWVNCDGGIFMSQDSGKLSFNKRQFGIAGTDFWGFGMGHKDGDVMLGGTYHNSHLMKNGNVYQNGWISYTGSADGTRGFVNPAKNKEVYNDSRRDLLSADRTVSPTALTLSKLPNTGLAVSKIIWDPRCYNCIYTGTGSDLWYSEDDGVNWTLVKNFGSEQVADIEIGWDDPNIIWITTAVDNSQPKKIWKSMNKGVTWADMTPSNTALGFHANMWFNIALGTNSQDVWLATTHRYGWYNTNAYKIFYSSDGGATWTNWTTATIATESINDMVYQRGTNGGIYIGTRRSVFYRNKAMSDWVQFDNGLPASTDCTRLLPWYKEGKIRNATNRSVWESALYEIGVPHAQPMVDKFTTTCIKDTFHFADYSAHHKSSATFQWVITPTPIYISSVSVENPKVVFGATGNYTVALTVTDAYGTNTKTIPNMITLQATSDCSAEGVAGKSLTLENSSDYFITPSLNLNKTDGSNNNELTLMAWIRPNGAQASYAGILSDPNSNCVLNLRNNNELGFHYNGSSSAWSWSSGLTVPNDKWSHVVLVLAGTQVRLYLNGKEAIHSSFSPVALDFSAITWYVGRFGSRGDRPFKGSIEEVCFYNRALNRDEIREKMHLTKDPTTDNSLKGYFQFNEIGSNIYNKAATGASLAALIGSATRPTSTAPVGTGVSERLSVTTGGIIAFANEGLSLQLPTSGTLPSGELCVTRLNNPPDALPSGARSSQKYWIINNFGTNSTFSALEKMTLTGFGQIYGSEATSPSNFKLYKRESGHDQAATWGSAVGSGTAATAGTDGVIEFNTPNVTSFSQFTVVTESVLPLVLLDFGAKKVEKTHAQLNWTVTQVKNVGSFEVERSFDGQHFVKIGEVKGLIQGALQQHFDFKDVSALKGMVYYRLKIVDLDARFEYSKIISLLFDTSVSILIYPNPTQEGSFLTIQTNLTEPFEVVLTDITGKMVRQQTFSASENQFDLKELACGVYMMSLKTQTHWRFEKIVIQ